MFDERRLQSFTFSGVKLEHDIQLPVNNSVPRWMTSAGNGNLLVTLGPIMQVAEVDPRSRRIVKMWELPRQPVIDLVRQTTNSNVQEIEPFSCVQFREAIWCAVQVSGVPEDAGVLLSNTGEVVLLEDGPKVAIAIGNSLLAASIIGKDSVALWDGESVRYVQVGDGAEGLAFRNDVLVSVSYRAGTVAWIDPASARVIRSEAVPWPSPKGVAFYGDDVLVAAAGSQRQPGAALVRFTKNGVKTIQLGIRNVLDVVVDEHFAVLNGVNDDVLVVVDLDQNRVVARIPTDGYPGSIAIVRNDDPA